MNPLRSWLALLVFAAVAAATVSGARGQAGVVDVPAGGDLQAVIDSAQPGTIIALAPGATYEGNFILRAKPAQSASAVPIVIRTGGDSADLPGVGERVTPAHGARLAKLRSPNRQPTLRTEAGARHWRLELLEFPPDP
jgi:hypothetical protein